MKMPRLLLILATTVFWAATSAPQARASTNLASRVDRTLSHEPTYQTMPKYCLLTLGGTGGAKVWMVEDGKRLFVDKNANGDLTDDGPPLAPSKVRTLTSNSWDFEYVLDAITPTSGTYHADFVLRRWNYDEPADSYGLSLSVAGQMPMYAGWFGTFWSTNRVQAPVIHFGGPFTPRLLRREDFPLGETNQRLSLCFLNPGSGAGTESRLSIDALPRTIVPKLQIEWPATPGAAPLRTSYKLTQRCCYWEFYTTEFAVPQGAVVGQARVSVVLPAGEPPLELTTTEWRVPVVARPREPEAAH